MLEVQRFVLGAAPFMGWSRGHGVAWCVMVDVLAVQMKPPVCLEVAVACPP